jgi:hypothetical protein
MPPHCDSLDGPVVAAARHALAEAEVDLILPYVHAEAESEVRDALELTLKARAAGGEAQEVADRWFFETVVRVHRAGEGAPFTGLKPAGLAVGPVIPVAERALERGSAAELADLLSEAVREQVQDRHAHAMALGRHANEGVPEARAYVEAMLGLQVWAHHLYQQILADQHAVAAGHQHG